jgi:CheY-like chemotaxis protein/nitrogen-specific signal transduction histidine kinase
VTAHILIVDDNPTNMKLAANVLEDAGCKVAKAGDAAEALALLATIVPDLILMDIAMPGMDGLTLTRKLKADKRYRRIPIVALTASAMKGDDAKAHDAGCHGYITKPIDTRRFATQVFAFLPGTEAAQTNSPRNANGTLHILIVDDHPANRKVLRAGLEGEGHIVHESANGQEALNVLERMRVDAVVSDILMPTMDGFRLCLEIRNSNAPYATLPFILYTATYDSPGDRALAQSVGADGYVLKPAPISVMLQALREAQEMHPQRRPTAPSIGESDVLEQYNAALVHKLEERNEQLQQSIEDLQSAHEQILALNRDLETRVEQRTAALDAANKELESFSYTVAHDLRAPLRHISGFADLIQETAGAQLNEECQGFIAKIMSATQRMDQLIHDLLEFSRSARSELHAAEIDLEKVLAGALDAVYVDTRERNIEWRRAPLPKAQGDPALLHQVFINLLSNAIKYSRTRNPAVIEIGCRAGRAHEVVIFIRDNGVGFDMRHADKLFGVFQRLHAGNEFEGTGIGLANVQRIISRHGGRAWAEAAVDHGATFYFSLPSTEAPRPSGA